MHTQSQTRSTTLFGAARPLLRSSVMTIATVLCIGSVQAKDLTFGYVLSQP